MKIELNSNDFNRNSKFTDALRVLYQTFNTANQSLVNLIPKSFRPLKTIVNNFSRKNILLLALVLRRHKQHYSVTPSTKDNLNKFIDNFLIEIKKTLFDKVNQQRVSNPLIQSHIAAINDVSLLIIEIIYTVINEDTHTTEYSVMLDELKANILAFDIKNLSYKDKRMLVKNLRQIKEIWHANDLLSVIKDFKESENCQNVNGIIEKLIRILILEQKVLEVISDEKLIDLYDRTKNFNKENKGLIFLLEEIYNEVRFRHINLKPLSHDLYKKFQSYDALINQFKMSKFTLAEYYYLKPKVFYEKILMVIYKHWEIINLVDENWPLYFRKLIELINNKANINNRNLKNWLNKIDHKLEIYTKDHVIERRYVDLDHFQKTSLKKHYQTLFNNINQFLSNKINDLMFKDIIVNRLAHDYCLDKTTQISSLSSLKQELSFIEDELTKIDFKAIFKTGIYNRVDNFNFRKKLFRANWCNKVQYVELIYKYIISILNNHQLAYLIKNSSHNPIFRKILNKVIKKRCVFFNLFKLLLTGRYHEFKVLISIKKEALVDL